MKAGPTPDAIENLIRTRQTRKALAAIPRFLRSAAKRDPSAVFQACDWYRRLGFDELGYRLVEPKKLPTTSLGTRTPEGLRLLWAARFLNLMGATGFATALLRKLNLETAEDHRIVGAILAAHFDYEEAERHLERFSDLDPNPGSYQSRISRLNLADAYAGRGKLDRAIQIAREVRARSPEPLLQGITLQAEGEFLARSGDTLGAIAALEAAKTKFPEGDTGPDFAILMKWIAYCQAKLGRTDVASRNFEIAFGLLSEKRVRPEAWLDVLRLQAECGLLDSDRVQALARYPGTAAGFQALLAQSLGPDPGAGCPPRSTRDSSRAEWCLSLAADEYQHMGERKLDIPTELRALAFLRLSHPWGLRQVCLNSLLWPGEIHAFTLLEGRLHQILRRLRTKHGMDVSLRKNLLRLSEEDARRVEVSSTSCPFPSLLESEPEITRERVQSYYGLSSTQAWAKIRQWEQQGWIARSGTGTATRYKVERSRK